MYNSIQHFLKYGTKKIENNIKNLITNGESFGEFVLNLEVVLHELGRTICKEVLEDIDKEIKEDKDSVNGACQCAMIRAYHIVGGIPTEKGLANHS